MEDTDDRFSTGVRFLDMELGGGIPVGDLVALTTPPGSQSEILFQEAARVQSIQYLSTICTDESELRTWIEPSGYESQGELAVRYVSPDALLDEPATFFEDVPADALAIIDPIDPLEDAHWETYLDVLNTLKSRLRAVGSVGIVHGLDAETATDTRSLTLKRADHVWRLGQEVESNELTTTLTISKSRGNDVPREAISIELADEVRIDTSRNIA